MTEEEIRLDGFEWNNVQRAFIWSELSNDFIRELVEADPRCKTQLEHHLLMAFHGYAQFPRYFYQNMYNYLKLKLAEEKELEYYTERVGMLYMNQLNREEAISRQVYKFVDGGTGKVLDTLVW